MKHIAPFGRSLIAAVVAIAVASLAGCMKSDPPRYRLNVVEMDLKEIAPDHRQSIANILEAMFGTPDEPYVLPQTGLDSDKVRDKVLMAAGPVWSDQQGKQRGLYRQHCGHCHGTTGDGIGPTAAILNPYPRDYRQGKFKFKSTYLSAKPTDDDLRRILHEGIVGTAMPSFALLPSAETDSLIEYVKYLSMRGQMEIALINEVVDLGEGESLKTDGEYLLGLFQKITDEWAAAKDQVVEIPDRSGMELAESIENGRKLFFGDKANCVKCHGPTALGDGQTTDYDDWTKPLWEAAQTIEPRRKRLAEDKDMSPEERANAKARLAEIEEALASALPVRTIKPRNLRLGIYRGGRRPVDVYRRIHTGITGVPMPGMGAAGPGGQGALQDAEIWNLVDYVRSLPLDSISKPPRPTSVVKIRN